ncbi:MAG: hypothetical protein CMH13_17715 [Martelella sp.]|uniref:C4-dicarboxylate TRAP transporter substrate-binding protein n=1 Tax=unclassified Martelella TaxID=2629616 RepID=UPI000C560707|nr:C4-dicarboxylate TRAP transporter substrate-binding protein [Martelella sp.]MAU22335.1 hypothetical protein [Martelella sp.]
MHLTKMTGVPYLAAVSAIALVISAGGAHAAEQWLENLEPRTLKLADFSGDQNANFGAAMVKWEEAITEFTEGKITFENYWSASLLGALDTAEGVADGVADIGLVLASYIPQEFPVGAWFYGFGSALTGSTVHDVAAGGATALETAYTFQPLIDEFAEHNLKILQTTSTPPYNLLCNTPVSTLEDAKGKRMRTSGPVWADEVAAIGATSVSIAFNETYEALQRGVIDCIGQNPYQLASAMTYKDVAKEYVPVTLSHMQSSAWVMNLDTWNSFPPELQAFINEQNIIAASNIWKTYLELEAKVGDLITAEEIRVNDVSELEPVIAEQRAKTVAAMAETAPSTIENPQEEVDRYLERLDYWRQVLVDQGHPIAERSPAAIMDAFTGLSDVDLSGFIETYKEEAGPVIIGQ